MTMSTFLTQMGLVFSELMSWLEIVLDTVTSSPVLLTMCVAIPIVQVAVNLFNRLIRL